MIQTLCPVTAVDSAGPNLYVVTFHAPEIAGTVLPGQFVNIKVNDLYQPFLRRPFSVYRVEGPAVQILFNIAGAGTRIIAMKRREDILDVIGPLGHPYGIDGPYDTALLVGGGLGVAPFPLLTMSIHSLGRRSIVTFLGARTGDQIVTSHLQNVSVATDDGSAGHHGTVVDLLRARLTEERYRKPKIFACGPNAMLRNLSHLAAEFSIPCEVSLESAMACGIGICQGCPVEMVGGRKKYSLICKDGPIFDSRSIKVD